MPRKKRLTANQSELVATYLPQQLQNNRKLTPAVKLVLANIYQLHYLQKNWGSRTVFRTRQDFMDDIEANFKEDVIRPQAKLMELELVYIRIGIKGRATEYTLNDELYELLPTLIKGDISEKFKGTFKCNNQLMDSNLDNKGTNEENKGTNKCDNKLRNSNLNTVESENAFNASLNSVTDSHLQHLNVPSVSDTLQYSTNNSIISEDNIYKNSLLRNSNRELTDTVYFKEKKKNIKRKKEICECHTHSDGTVESENNFSNFTNMEKKQYKQGSNSIRSYDDVIGAMVNRIQKGQPFSEEGLRDYVFEQFISKGTATSEQWDSDFIVLQRLKDLHGDVTEDTVTPTENENELNTLNDMKESQSMCDDSHTPSAIATLGSSDSEEPPHSRPTPLDKGSLSEDNFPDGQEYHEEEKCSQNHDSTPKTATNHVCSYEEYLEQHLMWGKLSSSGFAVEHFIEVAHPFVDSGDVTEEQYQRDLASLRQLSGYVTENELVSALTSDPLVPYGVSADTVK